MEAVEQKSSSSSERMSPRGNELATGLSLRLENDIRDGNKADTVLEQPVYTQRTHQTQDDEKFENKEIVP